MVSYKALNTAIESIISNRCDGIGNGEGRQTRTAIESTICYRCDGVFLPLISNTLRNADTARIILRFSVRCLSDFRSKVVGIKVVVDAVNECLCYRPLPEEAKDEG